MSSHFVNFYPFQGFWMAAKVCTILWKSSGSFNTFFATLSVSVGLDGFWYLVVHQCKKLCKFTFCFFFFFPVLFVGNICQNEEMFFNLPVARRRSEMGVPYLVAFQLLWTRLHCLHVFGKGQLYFQCLLLTIGLLVCLWAMGGGLLGFLLILLTETLHLLILH